MGGGVKAAAGVAALAPGLRNLDPYLHVDPCFVNVATCLKVFGEFFKQFYLSRTIKESTEFAAIFNHHLLVTFAMDAARDRGVKTLGETLAAPRPGGLFCSTETLAGTADVTRGGRARNRVLLPYEYDRDVVIDFESHNFLSEAERRRQAVPTRAAMLCRVELVKPDLVAATPLFMGTPSFTHFRNRGRALDLDEFAPSWFETLPGDIDEISEAAAMERPAAAEWTAALARLSGEEIRARLREIIGGVALEGAAGVIAAGVHRAGRETAAAMVSGAEAAAELTPAMLRAGADRMLALAATPAELWIVQHRHRISAAVADMVRAFAVAPHAPRRFCLIDGADTWRILKAYGKV